QRGDLEFRCPASSHAGRKSTSLRIHLRCRHHLDHLFRPFPLMLLLLVTFTPIVAAILIMIGLPARLTAMAASVLTLLVSAIIFLRFNATSGFQFVVTFPISPELRLNFALGVDGLSLLMILLGAIVLV